MNKRVKKTNLITPAGLENLRKELKRLRYRERPEVVKVVAWAASNGDRSENGDYLYGKRKLREIDRRCEYLARQINNAKVIEPTEQRGTTVEFGATVEILDEEDRTRCYTLVGVDEIEVERGRISWKSPVARALLSKKEGDWVTIKKPAGDEEVEIVSVRYLPVE